nr:MAG TPA: hypothetical protein [Caudoviricetes sp.]
MFLFPMDTHREASGRIYFQKSSSFSSCHG